MSHRQRRVQIPRRVSSAAATASETSPGRVNNRDSLPMVDRMLEDHQIPARPSDSRTRAEHSLQTTPDIRATTAPLSSILETDNDPSFHEPLLYIPPPSHIESHLSAQELRQRASSPLLDQFPRRDNAPSSPLPFHPKSKPLRVAESASSLRSFYDPRHSPPSSTQQTPSETSDLALRNYFPAPSTSRSASELEIGTENVTSLQKDRRPSPKPKLRPPMIDLSKLFPKPKEPSVPLLSPNRMMASPSPVSVLSDDSTARTTLKFERFYKGGNGNKLTKAPGRKDSTLIRKQQKQQEQLLRQEQEARIKEQQRRQQVALERLAEEQERQRQLQLEELLQQQAEMRRTQNRRSGLKQLEQYTHRIPKPFRTETDKEDKWMHTKKRRPAFSHWFDGPEGQISDDDEDEDEFDIVAEEHVSELPGDTGVKQTFCESVYSHANSFSSSIPSNTASGLSSSNRTLRVPSTTSVLGSSCNRDTSPGLPCRDSTRNTSVRGWESRSRPSSRNVERPSVTNKRSTMTLDSSNLNEASVLCLSSSEDEEDDDNSKTGNRTFVRDSIATFDEGEICTARTAIATTRRPSIRSVRASGTYQNRTSRPTERVRQPSKREPSVSSSTHSSNIGRVNASRGSSIVPAISEPAVPSPISSTQSFDFHLPRPRSRVSCQQTPDRRSRFLAVTRQEEYLLELLRKNKGVFPPNLFGNDNDSIASGDPEGKFDNRQSLSSYYSDASFLKLGPSLPPSRRPSQISHFQASTRTSEVCPSYVGGSEHGDLSPGRSNTSPRASLVHSDTMTSPSTGLASPRTPMTTSSSINHRVSLTNPHPPPSFSPPPVPEQHRHSRTRTDSSSAIVFRNNDSEKETHVDDLPIWALGWNQELTGLAVAH